MELDKIALREPRTTHDYKIRGLWERIGKILIKRYDRND